MSIIILWSNPVMLWNKMKDMFNTRLPKFLVKIRFLKIMILELCSTMHNASE